MIKKKKVNNNKINDIKTDSNNIYIFDIIALNEVNNIIEKFNTNDNNLNNKNEHFEKKIEKEIINNMNN